MIVTTIIATTNTVTHARSIFTEVIVRTI